MAGDLILRLHLLGNQGITAYVNHQVRVPVLSAAFRGTHCDGICCHRVPDLSTIRRGAARA